LNLLILKAFNVLLLYRKQSLVAVQVVKPVLTKG